jgi:hypothetical protein
VNQAVVIAFAGIRVFNAAFTMLMLGWNPDMQVTGGRAPSRDRRRSRPRRACAVPGRDNPTKLRGRPSGGSAGFVYSPPRESMRSRTSRAPSRNRCA